ncbi:MAG: RidA family protein [Nitrososphaerales archaeon]|jgi:2-iminobutanoate/2-iminopropanoate deaminase
MVKKIITTPKAPGSQYGPFSQAVRAGDFLFLMGQAAFDPEKPWSVVGDDIKQQTRRTLENLKTIIEAAGGSLDDVVQVRAFLTRAEDWPLMNEAYREYFKKDLPARTAVVVELATKGLLVEIDAIAYLGK